MRQALAQLLRQQARGDVDGAAGRKRIDNVDDALGIGLRRGGCDEREQRQDRNREEMREAIRGIRHSVGSHATSDPGYVIPAISASMRQSTSTARAD
jgi:hypothetical protein